MLTLNTPADLVDTSRYPFDDDAFVDRAHAQFVQDGVCVLPGFLRAEVIGPLVAESDALARLGHRSLVQSTPYLAKPDDAFPAGHPRCALEPASVVAVAYDLFPADSLLRRLYEWDELKELVRRILGVPELYRYADPFGALNLAVMEEGDLLGWHFDFTDFVVSIAIQSSTAGGDFLNAKQLRTADDERYDDVAAVLRDDAASDRVRVEPMTPGTLMLFNGRRSLHKVSPIEGDVPRYVALLSYDTQPGADSSPLLKQRRYGRLP